MEPGTVPDEFILRIFPHGHTHECHVTWRSKDSLGVEFAGDGRMVIPVGLPNTQQLVLGEKDLNGRVKTKICR